MIYALFLIPPQDEAGSNPGLIEFSSREVYQLGLKSML